MNGAACRITIVAQEIEVCDGDQTRSYWLKVLREVGVPVGLFDYAEVFADPQVQARGMVKRWIIRGGRIRVSTGSQAKRDPALKPSCTAVW